MKTTNLVVDKWTLAFWPCSNGRLTVRGNVHLSGSIHLAPHLAHQFTSRKRAFCPSIRRAIQRLQEGMSPARQALAQPAQEATWLPWPAAELSRLWGARPACPTLGGPSAFAWTTAWRRAGLGAWMFVLWWMTQVNEYYFWKWKKNLIISNIVTILQSNVLIWKMKAPWGYDKKYKIQFLLQLTWIFSWFRKC